MNIFISGIGGVGMGAVALLARDDGHSVIGSDVAHSLTTKEVEDSHIKVFYEQTAELLQQIHTEQKIDWYLYTSALPDNHPELLAAKNLGIRTSKRDEFVNYFVKKHNLKLLAVAGTHGKTTTSAMLAWSFLELNEPISYLLGSQVAWGASGRHQPGSEYFVYECDEFDRNFLQFKPYLSIITSLEYDHPDTYPTRDSYKSAFRQFIDQSDSVIIWNSDNDWLSGSGINTLVLSDDPLQFNLYGIHNRRNATLAEKGLERINIGDRTERKWALDSFPGVYRRFEKLADNLYSDYGHTPTEIMATLQLASEVAGNIMLIYQPHQNIRQHEMRNEYTDKVFTNASEVYWLATYLTRENPELSILSAEDLTSLLTRTIVRYAELNDKLWEKIRDARENGSLVLCMGAGSIDRWVRGRVNDDGDSGISYGVGATSDTQ